jgi:CBS domain-containing protein
MSPTSSSVQALRGSYLTPALEHARVYDVMRVGLFTCPPETPLKDVARMMATHHVHCVVVTDIGGGDGTDRRRWGVISDLDLVRAGTSEWSARDAAATELVTVASDDALEHAVQIMAEHDVAHLIVVAPQTDKPVGVLSTLDIAGVLAWGEG